MSFRIESSIEFVNLHAVRLSLLFILCIQLLRAEVVITGEFTHYETQKNVKDVQVAFQLEGSSKRNVLVANNGRYTISLDSIGTYIVSYEKSGYYTKKLKILTTGIAERQWKKGLKMLVDMDMVERIEGFDESVFYEPIGIAFYDPGIQDMMWETTYTRQRFNEIDGAFKVLEGEIGAGDLSDKLPGVSELMSEYEPLFMNPKEMESEGLTLLKTSPSGSNKKAFYLGQLSYHLRLNYAVENFDAVKAYAKKINLIAGQLTADSILAIWDKQIEKGLTNEEIHFYLEYLESDIIAPFDIHQIKLFHLGVLAEMLYAEMLDYQKNKRPGANVFIAEQKQRIALFNEHLKQKAPLLGDKLMGVSLDLEKLNAGYELIPDEPKSEQLSNDKALRTYDFPSDWDLLLQIVKNLRSKMAA